MNSAQKELVEFLNRTGFPIEYDNDGQIIIYTGLWVDDDNNLLTENPNEEA